MHHSQCSAMAVEFLTAGLCLSSMAAPGSTAAIGAAAQQPPRVSQHPFPGIFASWDSVRSIDGVNYFQVLARTEEEHVYRNIVVGPIEALLDRRNDPHDLIQSSERFVLPTRYLSRPIDPLVPIRLRGELVDLNGDGEPELSIDNALVSLEDPPSLISNALFGDNANDANFATGYRAFYDVDGDGDLDAFVSGQTHTFFENRGDSEVPVFVNTAEETEQILAAIYDELPPGVQEVLGDDAASLLVGGLYLRADADGDGDRDLLNFTAGPYFENTGSEQKPVFASPFNPLPIRHRDLFAILDFDSDGDLDVLAHVPNRPRQIAYYEHMDDRPLAFHGPVILDNFPLGIEDQRKPADFFDRHAFESQGAADLDGDGMKELLLDGAYSPKRYERPLMELVTLRDGAFEPVAFILESDSVKLEDYGRRGSGRFFDHDRDGDLDVVYSRPSNGAILFEQIGPLVFAPARMISSPLYEPHDPMRRVDLDNDGDLDIVSSLGRVENINLARSPGAIRSFSTNSFVGSGSALQICGFVIEGESPQTVILRGLGPSLASQGVNNPLSDPMLQLHAGGRLIASNDDWRNHPEADRVESAGIAPTHVKEAALRVRLSPGAYTVHLRGEPGDSGVGILAIDVDSQMPTDSMQVNMSGRTWIGREQGITIGGFVIEGDTPVKVLIRGLGPSLRERGVAAPLPNPRLRLHRGNKLIAVNDDWRLAVNADEIAALPNAPKDDRDAAILRTLAPGSYTVHMRDSGDGEGIGIIAVDRP